jgi:hypothetical protein
VLATYSSITEKAKMLHRTMRLEALPNEGDVDALRRLVSRFGEAHAEKLRRYLSICVQRWRNAWSRLKASYTSSLRPHALVAEGLIHQQLMVSLRRYLRAKIAECLSRMSYRP